MTHIERKEYVESFEALLRPAFRPATLEDVEIISKLLDEVAIQSDNSVLGRSVEEIAEVINSPNCLFCVCEEKGQVVGCASIERYKSRDRFPSLGELRSVAISKSHSGRGLGRDIVEYVLQIAQVLEIDELFATTNKPEFFKRWFNQEKGGDTILWMTNLDNGNAHENIVFSDTDRHINVAAADDVDGIESLMKRNDTVFPLTREQLESCLDSFYIWRNDTGEVMACIGEFIYDSLTSQGTPRMAEIRGLIVSSEVKDKGIVNSLLKHSFQRFKSNHVKQAFMTVPVEYSPDILKNGYFQLFQGWKSVVWRITG